MREGVVKTKVVGVGLTVEDTVYAIVDMRGNMLAQGKFITTDYPDVNDYATHLAECILSLAEENGGYETIRSVGISVPSGNFMSGCIEYPPNLPWKGQTPLAAMLRDRMGLAVALGNDAHVRALSEYVYGSAHGLKDFIYINLGHGVGSCIFYHDKVYLGADGFAGEVGHTCVEPNGRQCSCGNRGCLETYCAAKGIMQTARELLETESCPSLMREREIRNPKDIFLCCEEGDELAIRVFRETGIRLGVGLANYASIVNPDAIVVAGGIAHAGHWLLDSFRQSFEEHVFHNLKGRVKLLTSILNEDERDILGASALAWEVKEYSLFI